MDTCNFKSWLNILQYLYIHNHIFFKGYIYPTNQHRHMGLPENRVPKTQWHNGLLSFSPMKMAIRKVYQIFRQCHIKQNVGQKNIYNTIYYIPMIFFHCVAIFCCFFQTHPNWIELFFYAMKYPHSYPTNPPSLIQ